MAPFVALLSVLGVMGALVAGVYGAAYVLAPSVPLESGPFLSGWRPQEHALSRFHVRWYAVTMVFLAFDMEMVFMYPWALVVASVGAKAVVEMFAFLALIMIGVLYAWREGALRWV
ncbi:NADH-quinone oxidoreductase subunit A [Actinomadura roseirufa]|uniref:NADH-quinone oxidoreductase subunit A n=1 Tax=Actinomadura roseirufa TaxID=2094049 RepID=UPI0010412B59|nr:NADH-quinone oxidoreductase subunit A [Actinomadura roseirufa]